MRITAQDLYNYTKCKHRVYLDANGDPAQRGEVSAFIQMLWEMGLQTETEYLRTLGDLEFENLETLSIDQAAARTVDLMKQGVALIYQGVIQSDDLIGRPDLLLKRTDAGSNFGGYYYEPIDIKAGRGWQLRNGKRTKFKTHYAFQVIFYRTILAELQGYVPPVAHIINVDKEIEEFDPADFATEFDAAFNEVKQLVGGQDASEPVLCSTCHQCAWYRKCRRWVERNQDPTLLFFVGQNKFQLKQVGLRTVADIAGMDVSKYLKPANKIPRMGKTNLSRMKQRAEVVLSGEPIVHHGFELPTGKFEIYFDIEDDPTRDLTYLYGMIEADGHGDWRYHYFLAESPDDEEKTVREFWDYVSQASDAVFYVYSSKERSSLRRLMERYGLDPTVYDQYVGCEYDLYTDLVVKYSDWPSYTYGIKSIAKQIGFSWRDPDPSGANSIVWYNEYLQAPSRKDRLQRILEYNEDDCRAMIAIKEYFERQ